MFKIYLYLIKMLCLCRQKKEQNETPRKSAGFLVNLLIKTNSDSEGTKYMKRYIVCF